MTVASGVAAAIGFGDALGSTKLRAGFEQIER